MHEYNHEAMKAKLNRHQPDFRMVAKLEDALRQLEEIYNKGVSSKKYLRFNKAA